MKKKPYWVFIEGEPGCPSARVIRLNLGNSEPKIISLAEKDFRLGSRTGYQYGFIKSKDIAWEKFETWIRKKNGSLGTASEEKSEDKLPGLFLKFGYLPPQIAKQLTSADIQRLRSQQLTKDFRLGLRIGYLQGLHKGEQFHLRLLLKQMLKYDDLDS